MAEERKLFSVNQEEFKDAVDLLTDEQAGVLLKGLLEYNADGADLNTKDVPVRLIFMQFRGQLDRFSELRIKKASSGKKGADKRWNDANGKDIAEVDSANSKGMANDSSAISVPLANDSSSTSTGTSTSTSTGTSTSTKEREGASGKPAASRPARKAYGSYKNVLLSDEDRAKFLQERPSDADTLIEAMSCYLKSKGKAYKDYLAALRSWARREDERRPRTISLHPEEDRDPYGSGRDIHALDDTLVAVMEGRA